MTYHATLREYQNDDDFDGTLVDSAGQDFDGLQAAQVAGHEMLNSAIGSFPSLPWQVADGVASLGTYKLSIEIQNY